MILNKGFVLREIHKRSLASLDCRKNGLLQCWTKISGKISKKFYVEWSETEPTKRANVRTADSNSVLMVAIDFRFSKG